MGDLFVNQSADEKLRPGREHWPDDMNTLGRACLNVINYRKQTSQLYASHKLLTVDFPILRREINNEYLKLTGHRLEQSIVKFTDGEIADQYENVRKGHFKVFANGNAFISDRPLFGETEGGCIVYAYAAFIAKYQNVRVIKIGFTTKNIRDYLRAKRIDYDPQLLATTLGDKADESRFKSKWRHQVADGNEWFWPDDDLLNWIPTAYDTLADDYHKIIEDVRSMFRIWKRNQ